MSQSMVSEDTERMPQLPLSCWGQGAAVLQHPRCAPWCMSIRWLHSWCTSMRWLHSLCTNVRWLHS
eukprot:63016-Chlamydomonas_euryale.AAC.3